MAGGVVIDLPRMAFALERLLVDRPGYVLDVVAARYFDGWLVRAQSLRRAWSSKCAIGVVTLVPADIEGLSRAQVAALLDRLMDRAIAKAVPTPRLRVRRVA